MEGGGKGQNLKQISHLGIPEKLNVMDMEQMDFTLILESDASTDSSINARGFPTIRTSRPPDVPHLPFSSHHCFLVLQLVFLPGILRQLLAITSQSSILLHLISNWPISAVAYFLPFFNGLQYGRFLFAQYPQTLGAAFEPLLPLLSLYRSVPYASFVAFFALYLGVVRNPSFSRYVRFNSMQAVVLDVLLVLPLLFLRIFSPGRSRIAFGLTVMAHNAIFVFTVLCFIYSLVYSILGRTPYLPFVAEAAGRQL